VDIQDASASSTRELSTDQGPSSSKSRSTIAANAAQVETCGVHFPRRLSSRRFRAPGRLDDDFERHGPASAREGE
jgi:hypothetical protein